MLLIDVGRFGVPWTVGLLLQGIPVALVAWAAISQYRTRDTRRVHRMIAAAGASFILVVLSLPSGVPPWVSVNAENAPLIALEASVKTGYDIGAAHVSIQPRTLDSTDRVSLNRFQVVIDGRRWMHSERTTLENGIVNHPLPPLPPGVRWRKTTSNYVAFQSVGGIVPRRFTRPSRVEVEGTVVSARPRLLGVLPLAVNTALSAPGVQFRIDSIGPTASQPDAVAWVRALAVGRMSASQSAFDEPLAFVLIDRNDEAVLLSSGGPSGPFGYAFALGGISVKRYESFLSLDPLRYSKVEDRVMPDLNGARLAVVHWVQGESQPVRLETTNIKFNGE